MTKAVVDLRAGEMRLRVRARGGIILRLDLGDVPLLRPSDDDAGPEHVACFPMAPLGNRIRENLFRHGDTTFAVTPNLPTEPLYLHGESWLADWQIDEASAARLVMSHHYNGPRLPHRYLLRQTFDLTGQGLSMRFDMTNTGDSAQPFGFGWHPYFPLTPGLRLTAGTTTFWSEGPGPLPLAVEPVPSALDFSLGAPMPEIAINNAFGGWSGRADIVWHDRAMRLVLQADPLFGIMQLFRPDIPGVDFFALEPMSHLPGATEDLRILRPGESLSGNMQLRVERLADDPVPPHQHRRPVS